MALQIWLPLNGDLHNQGLENITLSTNGATLVNGGKISNSCYNFDGTKYLAIPKVIIPSQTANWSFVCWFQLADNTTTTATCFFSERTGTNSQGYTIFIYPKTSQMLIDDGARWTVTPMTFTAGVWYHLAITRNPQGKKLYIDGQLKSSTTTVGSTSAVNTNGCLIGYAQSNTTLTTGSQGFKGKLNDVRIYNHCLSPEEVKKISQGLVLHYQLSSNIKLINPNLLPDTNVNSLNKVVAPYARYYESSGNGTYTKAFETISDPPVDGIMYGVHYKVTAVSGFHGVTWYSGGLVSVETGQQYTLSCYAKKITTGTTVTLKFQYGKSPYVSGTVNMIDDTDWHQYSWTFTPNTNSSQAAAGGTTRIYGPGLSTVGEAIICGYKLEKGNIATRWCEYGEVFPPPVDKIYDSSGFNNNGVLNDNTAVNISNNFKYQQAIKNNQSITSDTYLLKGNINMPESSALSFTWWMNPTQLGHQTSGIFSTSSESLPTDYQTTAANMRDSCFDCCNSAGTCVRINVQEYLTLNEWHHYALVYNGSQLIFYKDGEQKCSVNQTGKLKGFTSIFPFYSKAGGVSRTTSGSLSDFKIYVTALSVDDIMKSYKDSLTTAGIPRDLE